MKEIRFQHDGEEIEAQLGSFFGFGKWRFVRPAIVRECSPIFGSQIRLNGRVYKYSGGSIDEFRLEPANGLLVSVKSPNA